MKSTKRFSPFLLATFMFIIMITSLKNTYAQQQTVDSLNKQQQALVSIAALTAVGEQGKLKERLHDGLDQGLSINEIKEMLTQLYAYCGFPRSLNAMHTFMAVVDDRAQRCINDPVGKPFNATIAGPKDKYERGLHVLEQLTETDQLRPAPGFGEFAPRIDAFLKEHLFADIFDSEVLSYTQRELITISALAAMPYVASQLKSHISIGQNVGLTRNQLIHVARLIEAEVSLEQANMVREQLAEPLKAAIAEDMLIRISAIEIFPDSLAAYKRILEEEAFTSVAVEPGVIAILPMYTAKEPTSVRILEIYANQQAYEAHLTMPHFKFYKENTLSMVKSLALIDMTVEDRTALYPIFRKTAE